MFPAVEEQLKVIERGTAEIFPRDELANKIERSRKEDRPLRVKLGVDPTFADIHLGHAVPLRKLRDFQQLGHRIVFIIGDFTARVGDPSGRDKTRPQLTAQEAEANAATYLDQAGKILDMDATEVVRNSEWLARMKLDEVIKLTSSMTVARLLERDDFSKRYAAGNPISLHEFIYPLMQGYDSVVVRSDIEVGGTDQKFNLTVGRDAQRNEAKEPQVCITLPLLVGTDGAKKMSKSLGNFIGICEPPEEMYGKAMSIPDQVIEHYFELTTTVPMDEARRLLTAEGPMAAKMRLASEIVGAYHDARAAEKAAEHFNATVREGQVPEDIPDVSLGPDVLKDGTVWIVRLIRHCGFAASNGEARRLIQQGGVSLDGETVTDADLDLTPRDGAVLRAGKRNFARIRL